MPRDGANIYHRPPGTDAVPDTTIESSKYNAYVADIEQDLNLPRPIVAGGTGASDAITAMTNLSGQIANQQVTNYDSFPFKPGSFWSAVGATSAPNSINRFSGVCIALNDGSGDLRLEAAAGGGNVLYYRVKTTGAWGAWIQRPSAVSDLDAAYVNVAGDTMTGNLTIVNPATLQLNKPTGAFANAVFGTTNGLSRWQMQFGNGAAEGGSNAGSDFALHRHDDTGTLLAGPPALNINRATGNAVFVGTITAGQGGITGSYFFGNSGTKYLNYDGTNFNLNGGTALVVGGNIIYGPQNVQFGGAASTGFYSDGTNVGIRTFGTGSVFIQSAGGGTNYAQFSPGGLALSVPLVSPTLTGSPIFNLTSGQGYRFNGDSGTKYIRVSGNHYQVVNSGNSAVILDLDDNGALASISGISANYGYHCRAGAPGGFGANYFNLMYNSGPVALWIDSSNMGNITVTSDYRIKKDVLDLPGMWDTVKKLRPIKYTQADFTPPAQKVANAKARADHAANVEAAKAKGVEPPPAAEMPAEPMFKADNIERWGFIAHELQDTLIPTASTGVKDSPDTIQSPNPFTIIAALTKALQEAMTRIETLEARVAQPR